MSLIELKDVTKSYVARSVLAQVNLSIEEGEFVSIVGTSASGKTSLLKIACGLLRPSTGRVTFSGKSVEDFLPEASIVFQNYSLLPWLSALENVRLAVEAAYPHWSRARQQEQTEKYLHLVGLGAAMVKRPSQLSGGMRQRVAIARAFAVEPRVMFLDEPFGALDALTRSTLQQELAKLCQAATRPVTALMITNSVDEAILLSDRILALSRGPGATLSSAVPVPLRRPRAADLLMHDEQAVRVRVRVSEFLSAGAAPERSAAPHSAVAVRQRVPLEA
jgi:nitrate/nitrite transport system ATP-binding protein